MTPDKDSYSWHDIVTMLKARAIDLVDAIAIMGALAGIALMMVAMTGVGFIIGSDISMAALAIALIPNALAQSVRRLYGN